MTPEQFCYWLQGYAELNDAPPGREQWQSIREHLAIVFNKVTPPVRPMLDPIDIKKQLDKLRDEVPPYNPFYAPPGRWPDPSYSLLQVTC